jgi:hypothetical protein
MSAVCEVCIGIIMRFISFVPNCAAPFVRVISQLAPGDITKPNQSYEKLHEDSVFDSGRSGLYGIFCGGQAELQKDWQELSHAIAGRVATALSEPSIPLSESLG